MDQYTLLKSEDPLYTPDEAPTNIQTNRRNLKTDAFTVLLLFGLLLSISYNAALTIRVNRTERDTGRSVFSKISFSGKEGQADHPTGGLAYDTPTAYHSRTDFQSKNETIVNELWESMDTSPIAVTLKDETAIKNGIPVAGRFPWDNSKGVYYLKVFHDLHCLVSSCLEHLTPSCYPQTLRTNQSAQKLMHRKAVDLRDRVDSVVTWEHYLHCLDALRQDIMCRADDTPMYARFGHHVGDGQISMCRNWEKLLEWTQSPEHNACYHMIDDYPHAEHNLEKFAFCPLDSRYYAVSQAYFEKWGHVDPWVQ